MEPFARPHPLSELVEDPRNWRQRQRNESQQRVAPPQAQGAVHLQAAEGQHRAAQGAQEGGGRHGAGGVDREGVDKVGGSGHLKGCGQDKLINLVLKKKRKEKKRTERKGKSELTYEYYDHAPTDKTCADDWSEVVHALLSRPAVPEQPDGDAEAARNHQRDSVFGLHLAVVSLR